MSNLRQRNWAVLAAIAAFALIIFAITVVRIQQGVEMKGAMPNAEQPEEP
jgi:hypothetical protein